MLLLLVMLCFIALPSLLNLLDYELPFKHEPVAQNISIDAIVKQLPFCTFIDRYRQRKQLSEILSWDALAEKHRIQYWLSFGTLVGYVQRRGLLPHDQDIDINILSQDTQILADLAQTNFSTEYVLIIQPEWKYFPFQNRSYFESEGINFIAPNARYIHRESSAHIDIWAAYENIPGRENDTAYRKNLLGEYDTQEKYVSLPRDWTFPLQRCHFSSIKVWCPAQPEKLVAYHYGVDALNTSDTRCENGTWV
jgi:hypothetical protein